MILVWFILILLIGGLAAWFFGRWSHTAARWISLVAVGIDFVLLLVIWVSSFAAIGIATTEWINEIRIDWIPQFGIQFHLAMDSMSLLFVLLTAFLGLVSVLVSWKEITQRVGFFHFNMLWILAGITGVFLALDLFLFYFFWEMMLIPMYFLISIWGHENRIYAAIKFFLFTQLSGLLMFLAILALYFIHGQNTGTYTFDYLDLIGTALSPTAAMWIMFGFLIAFLVKLPMVPLHNWLPDAHTEAPTAGSVILAGLLLKTGAYGLLRFVGPLFPQAAQQIAPLMMALGAAGILYGALLAFAQTDLKRMVAYTSVSHMGFVLLGVFAWNQLALQGVIMQMLAHGFSTGALFVIVGLIQERLHTRDIRLMGGMWADVPRLAGVALVFALASLGMPGMANFVAEMLVLFGAFQANVVITIVATLGLVFSSIYALWFFQKTFHGPKQKEWRLSDLVWREGLMLGALIIVIFWLGLFPQPVLRTAKSALQNMQDISKATPQIKKTVQIDYAHENQNTIEPGR